MSMIARCTPPVLTVRLLDPARRYLNQLCRDTGLAPATAIATLLAMSEQEQREEERHRPVRRHSGARMLLVLLAIRRKV